LGSACDKKNGATRTIINQHRNRTTLKKSTGRVQKKSKHIPKKGLEKKMALMNVSSITTWLKLLAIGLT